jgi:uncharacterized protein (TIGR00255 family)
MNSMTGFGRAAVTAGTRRLVVELRSVNNRGIDVKVRGREIDAGCEIEIIRAVRAAVERGAVSVSVREDGGAASGLDAARVRAVHATLESLRQELGVPVAVDLQTVAAFLGDGGAGEGDSSVGWEVLRPALDQALGGLLEMRAREGRALQADLHARRERLAATVRAIATASASLPTRAARRLQERLATLAADVPLDPARLAQEVALLAERLDVSEELVRLGTHLDHLARLMAGEGGAAGRKMDFVIQEIGRELNTVGSKVQDAELAGLVIEGKAELEKIREQAQNIE